MPSSMTHTYFCLDVFQKLPCNYQSRVSQSLEAFKLFSQGTDPFMFYHFLIGKKAREAINIQKEMHTLRTRDYFVHVIHYIHDYKLIDHQEVMAYLYGFICHYFLDLCTHPLIYYKSGNFDRKDKETYRYNGLHQELEYNIDLYMVKMREKKSPYRYKIYKNIFHFSKLSPEVSDLMNHTIYQVYHYKNVAKLYKKSVRYMKYFFRFANHDPSGIKFKFYHFIDKITPKSFVRLDELSYHHDFESDLSYLNLEHQEWCYPWNNKKVFHTSFFDLYDMALDKSIQAIIKVTDMLESGILDDKQLNSIFLDLSFVTGRPCGEGLKMKYFDS